MQIFVFLGPSLNIGQAKTILPTAYYLPPVACGDIISIMPLKPDVIVIIDGYFENRPAVWHKEILFAINNGVIIYGASSMGALRAAELDTFGMIGIGEIYKRYKTSDIIDDDEVALAHSREVDGFKSYTIPMINIRITIELALKQKIITQEWAQEFLNLSKAIFYQERTYECLKIKSSHLETSQEFFNWFDTNYINQKLLDAREVLQTILFHIQTPGLLPNDSGTYSKPRSLLLESNFSNTALIRSLKIEKLAMPCSFFYDWMPVEYKIGVFAKLFKNEYNTTKLLAKTLGIAHDCGLLQIIGQQISFIDTLLDNTLYYRILNCLVKFSTIDPTTVIDTSYKILAKILSIIYTKLSHRFDTINTNSLAKIIKDIYRKHKINSKEQFAAWLHHKELDLNEFNFAITIFYLLDYFVTSNNLCLLYQSTNTESPTKQCYSDIQSNSAISSNKDQYPDLNNYFSIALSLNGFEQIVIKTMLNEREVLLSKNKDLLKIHGDTYAIMQDFIDAFEMRNFIKNLSNLEVDYLTTYKPKIFHLPTDVTKYHG